MTALVRATGYVAEAHASWGMWAIRCGHCRYGTGRLERFAPHFVCAFCGGVTEVIWPSEQMVAGVERLLMMRPDPSTRSWFPHETLADLMWENGQHGIFDNLGPELEESPPGPMYLSVTDNRVQVDLLPAVLPNQLPHRIHHRSELGA